jgi:hypothetical protein
VVVCDPTPLVLQLLAAPDHHAGGDPTSYG